MTTAKDVRELVKPLLAQDDRIILRKRDLFVLPIRHFFRQIALGESRHKDVMRLYVSLIPTFTPYDSFREASVDPMKKWKKQSYQPTDAPGYPEAFVALIRDEIIPYLKRRSSFEQIRSSYRKWNPSTVRPFDEHWGLMAAAAGDFDEASRSLSNMRLHHKADFLNAHLPGLGDRLIKYGNDLPREDKRAIIDYLHQREREAVTCMKLEKYWQPTPFPAEEKELV